MTAPAGRRDRDRALWVSVEGINGAGRRARPAPPPPCSVTRCLLLDELTDQPGDTLPGRVIGALAAGKDPFLRGGHPVAETLALLALQVRKAERLAGRDLAGVDVILEDRGVGTVAVYQAVIMCSGYPRCRRKKQHGTCCRPPCGGGPCRTRPSCSQATSRCARGASPAGSGIRWRRRTSR